MEIQDEIMRGLKDLCDIHASFLRLKPKSKRAIEKGWSKAETLTGDAFAATRKSGENVGIRLGEPSKTPYGYLHAIDFDVKKLTAEAEARAVLLNHCPNAMELPSVTSGSGGESRHFYFFAPEPLASWTIAKGPGWEVAVKGNGTYVVAPGSTHPDTGQPYRWEQPITYLVWDLEGAPKVDVSLLQRPEPAALAARTKPISLDQLKHALDAIDPVDASYEEWTQIGMGLHHESDGDETSFGLWDGWSQRDAERYGGERDLRKHWRSFGGKRRGRPVTGATILQKARDGGWCPWAEDDFPDLPALPEKTKPQPEFMRLKNGQLRATLHNAIVTLETVNAKKGLGICRNELTLRDEWSAGVIGDADLGLIRVAIEQAGMHCVGSELTVQAVRAVAEKNQHHPVRTYLASLTHDGTPRLDTWLTQYLQVQDSPYVRAVGRAFFIAMIARVMKPGCKHDHVLVLRGAQGLRKSTACSILGGPWYGDNMPSIRDGGKEAGLYLRGHWLIEMAELAPSRKAEQEDLKAFLTRASDEIRAPYARTADVVPRQCVFIGTSNEDAILKDATGGRRFWPVTVERQIDTDALARDRDQLFAEALAAFGAGEAWHLDAAAEAQAAEVQEAAREEDPWEQIIGKHLDAQDFDGGKQNEIRMSDLLSGPLDIPRERQTTPLARRAGTILRLMGWVRSKDRRGNSIWKRTRNDGPSRTIDGPTMSR
mgnify:FL=1